MGDEIWERAVEAALDGEPDPLATRTLTLDGAVKCLQGRLPPPPLLEKFRNLHHLSIANIGVSSLEHFPRLPNLEKLVLSDNRITSGLEFLVEAGLDSLRDLDLSNNRIQSVEDLSPLAMLRLVSLDLYECPVTRVGEYRVRVFGLVRSLKFLDKSDRLGNERPESDEDEEEEEDEGEEEEEDEEEGEDEEEEEEDPGSGEVDGDERVVDGVSNGHSERVDGVVDVDEDEESDAEDEEGGDAGGRDNGFRLQAVDGEEEGEDDGEDSESGDEDVVEVHEIEDSDNEEDGVDDDEEEEEDEEDEEEVDNDDRGVGGSGSSTGRLMNVVEIDGHEQGDDDEDNDGETGDDDQGVEDDGEFGDDDDDDEEEDEESGEGYLVQPVSQVEDHDAVGSDIEPINEDNDPDEEEEVEDDLPMPDQSLPSSSRPKRKRDGDEDDDVDDDDDDDDDDGVDDEED